MRVTNCFRVALGQREEAGDRYQTCKLVGVVLCAAGLAIFLLWLLFSGGEPQKVLSCILFLNPGKFPVHGDRVSEF